jgi:hypothetical protein
METTASTPVTASARLHAAFAAVRSLDLPDNAVSLRRAGLDVAEIVRTLDADDDVVIAAMLQPLLDANLWIGRPPISASAPMRLVSRGT